MIRVIWIAIAGLFTLFVYLLLHWGINPRPIKLIDLSEFDRAEKIGEAIYQRLRQELAQQSVVVMGAAPQRPDHTQLALGFLSQAEKDGRPFDTILSEPDALPENWREQWPQLSHLKFFEMDLNQRIDTIAEWLQRQGLPESGDRKVFIYTAAVYSSHILKGNPIHRLQALLKMQQPLIAISIAGLAVKAEELEKLEPPCRGLSQDPNGTALLGCAMATRSRAVWKSRFNPSRYLLVMDQRANGDYLALVHSPQ